MKRRNKEDRLKVVLEIASKLKKFPASDNTTTLDLYNSSFDSITKLKKVFNDYINQDDTKHVIGYSGKIKFPEINRYIEYILPIQKHVEALCVFKGV
jgi:hypothetical protein